MTPAERARPYTTLESLGIYAASARSLARATFIAKHPAPVFLVAPFAVADEESFTTVAGLRAAGTLESVAPLVKRAGSNAFTSMITIGRATNNDIVIPAASLSKFHAYVVVSPGGGPPHLTDAGSTGGTSVNGKRLAPKSDRHPLHPGTKVRLADLELTFLDPGALFDYLVARASPA